MYGNQQFDLAGSSRIYSLLEGGETVIRSARPQRGKVLLVLAPLMVFAIFWTAVSVKWIYAASGGRVPDFNGLSDYFVLFGVPFVLVGLVQFLGALWFLGRVRRIYYVVTDRKFIVVDGDTVHSFTPDELSRMTGKKRSIRPAISETSEYINRDYPFEAKPRVGRLTLIALLVGFFTLPNFGEYKDLVVKMKKGERG